MRDTRCDAGRRWRVAAAAFAVTACLAGGATIAAQAPAGTAAVGRQGPDGPVKDDLSNLAGLWSGGRYKIAPGDVIELNFPYVPEFNQTVSVQPDGFVSLRGLPDITAAGRSVPELKADVMEAYAGILRDPVVTLVLKEFEKPSFIVGGEVQRPGRYELRGGLTVTQALAVAGGKTSGGKVSDVLLFRRMGNDLVEVKRIDVARMYSKRDLSEDPVVRPGDTLFVPKSLYAKIEPFIPKPTAGFFLNPFYR